MYLVLRTPPFFFTFYSPRYLCNLFQCHLKTRKQFLKLWITRAVEWWCLKTASTNVSSKCSQKAWARATPDSALVGMLNIETIFPYFFSSTPGPLPSISFSHHANWQKLVPFALFIYLAETVCSLDATTSQNSNRRFFFACLFVFSALWWKLNYAKVRDETERSAIWSADAYL